MYLYLFMYSLNDNFIPESNNLPTALSRILREGLMEVFRFLTEIRMGGGCKQAECEPKAFYIMLLSLLLIL